jgi:hypothetical protein
VVVSLREISTVLLSFARDFLEMEVAVCFRGSDVALQFSLVFVTAVNGKVPAIPDQIVQPK